MMSEHDHTRELMHKFICDVLARVAEDGAGADFPHKASMLMDEFEKRCIGRVRGELIFSDPAEEAEFIEGGPFR